MKSCIAVLLLVLVILQSGGMLTCYSVQQEMIREEMREEMKRAETELETIVLSPEEFQKSRLDAHEISVDGKMYDVQSVEVKNGMMVIRALNDRKEESLIGAIKKLIHHSRDHKGRIGSGLTQLSFLTYLAADQMFLHPHSRAVLIKLCIGNEAEPEAPLKDDPGPPPELIFYS